MICLIYYTLGILGGILAYYIGYDQSFSESMLDFLIIFSIGAANLHMFLNVVFYKNSLHFFGMLKDTTTLKLSYLCLVLSISGFVSPFLSEKFTLAAIIASSLFCLVNAIIMAQYSIRGELKFINYGLEFVQNILTPFTLFFLWFTL